MRQDVLVLYTATIFCAWAFANDEESSLSPHIVGGTEADPSEYPFIVSIRVFGEHICGGNIIGPKLIITAAHCIPWKSFYKTVVVSNAASSTDPGIQRFLERSHVHPKYQKKSFDYDVGILVITTPWTFNEFTRPITLATSVPKMESKVRVAGWGYSSENGTNSKTLQEVTLKIIGHRSCVKAYLPFEENLINKRVICAGSEKGGKDSCKNDSGGPLLFKNQLLGIVFFGIGCGRKNSPGVYASIPHYYKWIQKITKMENNKN